MPRIASSATVAVLVLALACGGGGSTDDGDNTPPPGGDTIAGHIVFTSARLSGSRDLFIMDANGGTATPVANGDVGINDEPVLSPDGTRIAFSSNRDGNLEIYVINVDGSNIARLTNDPGRDIMPAWSPDGSRLAFVRVADAGAGGPLMVMNADGSGQVPLGTAVGAAPAWAPDGNSIAYGLGGALYLVDADGTDSRLLFDAIPADDPAWSPDGTHIAFGGVEANQDIYVINADGSGLRNLTNTTGGEIQPTWSPDGNYIAYTAYRSSNDEIARRKVDGTGERILAPIGAEDQHPSWSE